jgi:putative endonuclease
MTADRRGEAARRRALGHAGEDAAADFLCRRGFDVAARNYRTPYGELDVVAAKDGAVVFAEVKTARAGARVDPRAQFTRRKVARLYQAALDYLGRERPGEDVNFRFDFLVVVRRSGEFEIEHYEAVELEDYLPPEDEA